MPCYDPREHDRVIEVERIINGIDPEIGVELRAEVERLQNRNMVLTRLLCEAGRVHYGINHDVSMNLNEWWEYHRKQDCEHGEPW